MIENLAWGAATSGLLLGAALTLVPGFPGCTVALLGLLAFAGLTDFATVSAPVLTLAGIFTAIGAGGQLAGPALTSRAVGGASGAATGAVLGALLGVMIPVPGAIYGMAVVGSVVVGLLGYRQGLLRVVKGVGGASIGCCASTLIDAAAVLGIGALLAVTDTLALQAAGLEP
jgi:uncharacterized protein YqgC (DUF456 family)